MPFQKGNKLGGRPKGSKNKLTTNLVQEILEIADELKKKKKGLGDCAKENPKWFFEIFLKALLPKNIEIEHGLKEDTIIQIEFINDKKQS